MTGVPPPREHSRPHRAPRRRSLVRAPAPPRLRVRRTDRATPPTQPAPNVTSRPAIGRTCGTSATGQRRRLAAWLLLDGERMLETEEGPRGTLRFVDVETARA